MTIRITMSAFAGNRQEDRPLPGMKRTVERMPMSFRMLPMGRIETCMARRFLAQCPPTGPSAKDRVAARLRWMSSACSNTIRARSRSSGNTGRVVPSGRSCFGLDPPTNPGRIRRVVHWLEDAAAQNRSPAAILEITVRDRNVLEDVSQTADCRTAIRDLTFQNHHPVCVRRPRCSSRL